MEAVIDTCFLYRRAAEKIKRETDVKKYKNVLFSAFWGFSRQGEFGNTENKLSAFQKNHRGFFFGGIFCSGGFSFLFFL
jgi:hypothetical protein